MKKSLILISLGLLLAFTTNAQLPTEVKIGDAYTYTVNATPVGPTYLYHWTVSGGTASSTATTSNSLPIVWNGADQSTESLTVYAQNQTTGCMGNNKVKQYKLVTTLSYTATIGSPVNTCPLTDNMPAGGMDAKVTVAVSGTTVTASEIVTVSYTIDGTPQTPVAFAAGLGSGDISITDAGAAFTNTSGADIAKSIVVTGIAISGRNPVSIPDADKPSANVTIYAAPVINDIF